MTYYYETAPLPTWLAFRAHHLPVWWHHFESLALSIAVNCFWATPRHVPALLVARAAWTAASVRT